MKGIEPLKVATLSQPAGQPSGYRLRLRAPSGSPGVDLRVDDQVFVADVPADRQRLLEVTSGALAVLGPEVSKPSGSDEGSDHGSLVVELLGQGIGRLIRLAASRDLVPFRFVQRHDV